MENADSTGPVINGRTVKVGGWVRRRDGDHLPVLGVCRIADPEYPWRLDHGAEFGPGTYTSTGAWFDGGPHSRDLVEVLVSAPPAVPPEDRDREQLHGILRSLAHSADKRAADDLPQDGAPHPDDAAVDRFATDIKDALARARRRGRDGWRDANVITTGALARQMAAQFLKRTPSTWVDIAAYAMMLHVRGADPAVLAEASTASLGGEVAS